MLGLFLPPSSCRPLQTGLAFGSMDPKVSRRSAQVQSLSEFRVCLPLLRQRFYKQTEKWTSQFGLQSNLSVAKFDELVWRLCSRRSKGPSSPSALKELQTLHSVADAARGSAFLCPSVASHQKQNLDQHQLIEEDDTRLAQPCSVSHTQQKLKKDGIHVFAVVSLCLQC